MLLGDICFELLQDGVLAVYEHLRSVCTRVWIISGFVPSLMNCIQHGMIRRKAFLCPC